MKETESAVLSFARQEAGKLPIQLVIQSKPDDGYVVDRSGIGWTVTGNNARSCLYGVYHVRDGLGPGTFRTPWRIRGIYPCETLHRHSPEQMRRLIDRMGKWRFNTFVAYTYYGFREHVALIEEECAKRGIDVVYYYNTSFQFMRELDAPAHFAKNAAGKPFSETLMCITRPCFADPAVRERMGRAIETFFQRELPAHHRTLLFAPADGVQVCLCPSCRRLSPMEQWEIIQQAINSSMRRHANDRTQWSQIYVQRYRPPADLASYDRVDRIFFDTHLRERWHALGQEHETTPDTEAQADWVERHTPENVYLLDRIREWRHRANKPVTVFENLMVQGTFSHGQFNTPILLEDLRVLQNAGVDGMLYEAFEPGMDSFAPEFGHLARAMWDPDYAYQPTKLEAWIINRMTRSSDDLPKQIRSMANHLVSVLPDFPWALAEEELGAVHTEYLRRFGRLWTDVNAANAAAVVDHIYAYKERFDRGLIGFFALRRLFREEGIPGLTPEETRYLSYWKLWDFMDEQADPRRAVDEMNLSVRAKLG